MPKKLTPPTFDALMAALSAPRTPDAPGGLTVQELAVRLNWGVEKVRIELRALMLAGRLVTKRELRPGIDGCMRPAPVYSVMPNGNGKR